jgi:hypothetical protein
MSYLVAYLNQAGNYSVQVRLEEGGVQLVGVRGTGDTLSKQSRLVLGAAAALRMQTAHTCCCHCYCCRVVTTCTAAMVGPRRC